MSDALDGMAVLIEIDQDFDPASSIATGDDAEDAEYVRQHQFGELVAYGVSIVPLDDNGNVKAIRYRDGSCGPVRLTSVWGVDSEDIDADGVYHSLDAISDPYMREIASDLLAELDHAIKPLSTTIRRSEITAQSVRAFANYVDSRGPGEELSEALRLLLRAIVDGHSFTVTIP